MSQLNRQSLPARQLHLLQALACVAVLSACGKKDDSAPATVAVRPAVSEAALDAEISRALTPDPEPASLLGSGVSSAASSLDDQVDDIRRKHPNKNAVELLNVPEVNEKLREALTELSKSPKLRAEIDSSVDVAAAFMGLDGPPGTYKLNLDMTSYEDGRTDRMLKAVMTGKAKSIVDYVVGEVGEAAPDLSYGSQTRAPNGVALEPAPAPPTPPDN